MAGSDDFKDGERSATLRHLEKDYRQLKRDQFKEQEARERGDSKLATRLDAIEKVIELWQYNMWLARKIGLPAFIGSSLMTVLFKIPATEKFFALLAKWIDL